MEGKLAADAQQSFESETFHDLTMIFNHIQITKHNHELKVINMHKTNIHLHLYQ